MQINGTIEYVSEEYIVIRAEEPIRTLEVDKHQINGRLYASVEVQEKDSISALQRKHIYALMGDISEYEGYPEDVIKSTEKYRFMVQEGLDETPSFATNQMKQQSASRFIEMLIDYCIQHDIPFRKQQFYLTADTSKMVYGLTMSRKCVVCGQPHADIHHATNLVGMGNKRKNHDHWNSTYLALCRAHHQEAGSTPLAEFCDKYYVKPVKLTVKELKKIRVM